MKTAPPIIALLASGLKQQGRKSLSENRIVFGSRCPKYGYSPLSFGPDDKATPPQACTVILRHMGVPETGWGYESAADMAAQLGIAPEAGFSSAAEIRRSEMAILIHKAASLANVPADGGDMPGEGGDTPGKSGDAAPSQPRKAMSADEMKAEIVRLANIERARAGVPELVILPALMDTAQAKADDMRRSRYYGHDSPVYGPPGQMIRAAIPNARSTAENCAPWTRTPAEAFAGWVESPPHYGHITDAKYTHTGVGVTEGADGGYWWVQHFCSLCG